jgi:hypothetical protein
MPGAGNLTLNERADVNPPHRVPTVSSSDARHENRDQRQDRSPVRDERPARQGVVLHEAQYDRHSNAKRVPHNLARPTLVIPRQRARRLGYHRRAVNEQNAQHHQPTEGRNLQPIQPSVVFVECGVEHLA